MKNKNWNKKIASILVGIFILNLSTVVEVNIAYADEIENANVGGDQNIDQPAVDQPVDQPVNQPVTDQSPSNDVVPVVPSNSDVVSSPFTKFFTISAYYSPLPCQDKYVTGSYKSDIRLNGGGVHGADGTSVYPGMVAAPKSYLFGTKMEIPGIGTVAVHDRGGAIVHATEKGNTYDRLDIWMGYGDKGLKRALGWGKRTVEVTVHGKNESLSENVSLGDYDSSESVPNVCVNPDDNMISNSSNNGNTSDNGSAESIDNLQQLADEYQIGITPPIKENLELGDTGDKVSKLQEELTNLNFYRGEINGKYDALTAHAVFKFQQSQGLVSDEKNTGAGVFGPKTMAMVNNIISSRNKTKILIAQTTNDFSSGKMDNVSTNKSVLIAELNPGTQAAEVKVLQKFLKDRGYLDVNTYSEYFGNSTKEALIKFQLDNEIISKRSDTGAGRVGPGTLKVINSLS